MMDDLKERRGSKGSKLAIHSNRFDMVSNKGRSIMSNRSRGPSVNNILAASAQSMAGKNQRSAMAIRTNQGNPERSVSRGFAGSIAAKKFDEKELPEMGARRAQQPSQHHKKKVDSHSKTKNQKYLTYLNDDDV